MNKETIELLNMSWKEAHDSNRLSEWRDAESESFWYRHINSQSEQTTMILPDTGDFDVDDLYFDHAPSGGFVSTCYTREGLRIKEGWMVRQIINDDNRKYTLKDLKRMVANNPHYHDTIKANLIYNINNRE